MASIAQVHAHSAAQASRAVNVSLTLRNWAIGAYIRHYEQQGADRARYGARLLEQLATALQAGLDRCYTGRYLGLCRQLFDVYPSIRKSLISESTWLPLPADAAPLRKVAASRKSAISEFAVDAKLLIERLSFTHLVELLAIEDPLKRVFYEVECMRGNWAVRALKRQIATLYFERSGLSADKEKLAAMVRQGAALAEPRLAIRDPYVFEFLGLRAQDAVAESDLEAALVDHLREFLLELGHGFCLEAQQKSILIGKTRGFIDLVFYHRILKCHVLVELKVDKFTHEHIGQLNTYVSWYRRHMMAEGDNPPVGLLLCTDKPGRPQAFPGEHAQAGGRGFLSMGNAVGQITAADPRYPPTLLQRLGLDAAPAIRFIGNVALLGVPKTALFCSARCPGSAFLPAYDQVARWRDAGRCVVGGFHSPVEKECLRILLRGTQPVIVCPARSLPQRVPPEWRPAGC